ncbi:MAG: hypothetical protein HZA24_06085 [Nitrospirae bacterium]|nr:hypothetical protein [Nitrospirota bacterium]
MRTVTLGRTEIVTLPDPKDPADRQKYRMDWSALLDSGEAITVSGWSTDGLTTSSPAIESGAQGASVWLEGGSAGRAYTVSNRITTGLGRVVERSFKVEVAER